MAECDRETLIMRKPWPTGGGVCCPMDKIFFMMPFDALYLVISHNISLILFTQLLTFKGAVQQVKCND